MPPELPSLKLNALMVSVERISGHGNARASMSVRRLSPDGEPAAAVACSSHVSRNDLIGFACGLLGVAEQMIEPKAFTSTDSFAEPHQAEALRKRSSDATKRYFALQDRLPLLQLTQRVLERCSDEVAHTLLALLANADSTGVLPVKADVRVGLVGVAVPSRKSRH